MLGNSFKSVSSIPRGNLINVQIADKFVSCLDTLLCVGVDLCLKSKWLPYHTILPDLATSNFFPFPKLKRALNGKKLNITTFQAKSLDPITQLQTMHCTKCFERCHDRCSRCIKCEDEYFQAEYFEWDNFEVKLSFAVMDTTYALTLLSVQNV
jgi:hypothetical protein